MNEKQADMDILTHDCSGDSMSKEDLDGAHYQYGGCANCGSGGLMPIVHATLAFCCDDCEKIFIQSLQAD